MLPGTVMSAPFGSGPAHRILTSSFSAGDDHLTARSPGRPALTRRSSRHPPYLPDQPGQAGNWLRVVRRTHLLSDPGSAHPGI